MGGETDPEKVRSRARPLTSTLMDIWVHARIDWVHARIDPADAADLRDLLTREVSDWQLNAGPTPPDYGAR